jgi:hypothetical protein
MRRGGDSRALILLAVTPLYRNMYQAKWLRAISASCVNSQLAQQHPEWPEPRRAMLHACAKRDLGEPGMDNVLPWQSAVWQCQETSSEQSLAGRALSLWILKTVGQQAAPASSQIQQYGCYMPLAWLQADWGHCTIPASVCLPDGRIWT